MAKCFVSCLVCVSYIHILSYFSESCEQSQDCLSCTRMSQKCLWCPLDRQCHKVSETSNPCEKFMDITTSVKCSNVTSESYDADLAYTLAKLSSAAYSDSPQNCIDKKLSSMQLHVIEHIARKCSYIFEYGECYAFVAVSHMLKQIIISYRGSVSPKQVLEELTSILAIPKVPFSAGGNVQKYFWNSFQMIYSCLKQSVRQTLKSYPGYRVVVTGHSLGGAMASLAAASLVYDRIVPPKQIVLYNFGSPRIGDKLFAFYHDGLVPSSFRVVHYEDIIVHFPTMTYFSGTPYHHKSEIFYSTNMTKDFKYRFCKADEDDTCSNHGFTWKCFSSIYPKTCINMHRYYFGMKLSEFCRFGLSDFNKNNQTLDRRKKSRIWDKISSSTCTRIPTEKLD